jgi:hypothetical protein
MKTLRLLIIAPIFAVVALAADSSAPAAAPSQLPGAPEKVAPPAALADPAAVEAALQALHFDEMTGKGLNAQKQMLLSMARQSVARINGPGVSKEDLAAFPQKTIDAAWVGLSLEEVHAVAAHNYGEVFTTDELRAIADFFNSPAGQAFTRKQPDAQKKIMAALWPRMMQARQKFQQLTRDFTKQQLDKKAAAQAAAAKSAAASAAPTTGGSSAPAAAPAPAPTAPPKS